MPRKVIIDQSNFCTKDHELIWFLPFIKKQPEKNEGYKKIIN